MSIKLGPTLETDRLLLRPPCAEDIEALIAFHADPEVMRHLGGVSAPSATWRSLATMAGSWALHGFGMFSVLEKSTGRWIGRIGPLHPLGWPGTEVGWGLCRDAWGQGYALEAATASMDWVVNALKWTDIIHTIVPDNLPSRAVAQRLGSVNRGPGALPPPFEHEPIEIWGQSADQWRARRGF